MDGIFQRRDVQARLLLRCHTIRLRNRHHQKRIHSRSRTEPVVPACELPKRPHAKLRQAVANFFGKRAEIRDDHFRLALEARAKLLVLRGDAHGTSIQMALPRHNAPNREQRRRAETKLVGAKNRSEHDIPRKFQASVHAQREPRTQARANQRVVSFAQSNLPGKPRVLDGSQRRRSRAAIVPANSNDVSARLRHSRGNDAHAGAGNKLYTDARPRVHRAQIVY